MAGYGVPAGTPGAVWNGRGYVAGPTAPKPVASRPAPAGGGGSFVAGGGPGAPPYATGAGPSPAGASPAAGNMVYVGGGVGWRASPPTGTPGNPYTQGDIRQQQIDDANQAAQNRLTEAAQAQRDALARDAAQYQASQQSATAAAAAAAASQRQSELAAAGLQTSGFAGQQGLQTSQNAADAARQQATLQEQQRAQAADLAGQQTLQQSGFVGQQGLQTSQNAANAAQQQALLAEEQRAQAATLAEAQRSQLAAAQSASALQASGFAGQQGLSQQQADLAAAAQARNIGYIPQIMAGLMGAGGGVSYGPTGASGPVTTGPSLLGGATGDPSGNGPVNTPPTPAPVDPSDAIFARNKDRIGQIATSNLSSLRDTLGGRGMLGGGVEAGATANVLGTGQEELGNTVRQQMEDQLAHAQHVQDVQYQGALTQRGQNFSLAPSLLGLISSGGRAY